VTVVSFSVAMHTPAFSNVFVFFAVNNELEFGEEYILGEQKIRLVDSFGKPLPRGYPKTKN
jgi:hypothetical protein